MDTILINEFANIGLTILMVAVGWLVVNWLDKNVFNRNRYKRSNKDD